MNTSLNDSRAELFSALAELAAVVPEMRVRQILAAVTPLLPDPVVALAHKSFALQNAAHVLRPCNDVILRKPDLVQAIDVGEFIATLFEHHDGALETKPPLK